MNESAAIPYLASLAHYRRWMRGRLEGKTDEEAWSCVLTEIPRNERKHLARTAVAGAHGQPPLIISVPIIGGGSSLKKGRPSEWLISMHGRWQSMHIGALTAAYSATPFFPHIAPELERIIWMAEEGMAFTELTGRLHSSLMDALDIEEVLPQMRDIVRNPSEKFRHIFKEKNESAHTDLSILDVIFRKGRDGIFALV